MKRLFSVLFSCFLILWACSCGSVPKESNKDNWVQLKPGELLSAEEVASIAGYQPVMEETLARQKSTVVYQSDPVGASDPVIVDVYQYNGRTSEALIRQQYEEWKEKRPSSQEIDGFTGVDAFLAYPSLHLYKDGIHVVITAGSGADETQADLLQRLAVPVLEHLNAFLEQHPTDHDLAGDLIKT